MSSEIVVYVLIVAAFMAVAWVFSGRGEDRSLGHFRDARWKRLPGVFKMTWGFSTLWEEPVGERLASIFRKGAEKQRARAIASALPLTAARVYAASFALALICAVVAAVLAVAVVAAFPVVRMSYVAPVVLLMGVVGWFWPGRKLAEYAERRQTQLTRELPFAIDLISAAMRAGLDFGAAMRYYVTNTAPGPLVEEFSQVLSDTTLGRPFVQSLNDMAERIQLKAFTSFVGVVGYGAEIGAPISKTLKTHGEDLRRERFHLAEQKAAKAPLVMIIPLVLFLMPSVFIIVLTPMFLRMSRVFIH